jgi:hypothetical protein
MMLRGTICKKAHTIRNVFFSYFPTKYQQTETDQENHEAIKNNKSKMSKLHNLVFK